MLRLNRTARIASTLVVAGLALGGCANNDVLKTATSDKTHTVRMTVSSTEFPATLSYQVGSAPAKLAQLRACVTFTADTTPPTEGVAAGTCTSPSTQAGRFLSRTVTVRAGTRVSVTGAPPAGRLTVSGSGPAPETDTYTCTIAVDGVPRLTHSTVHALGAPVPSCTAAGYVGERPFQLTRLLEYLAVGLCLLVVVVGFAIQLIPQRRRA